MTPTRLPTGTCSNSGVVPLLLCSIFTFTPVVLGLLRVSRTTVRRIARKHRNRCWCMASIMQHFSFGKSAHYKLHLSAGLSSSSEGHRISTFAAMFPQVSRFRRHSHLLSACYYWARSLAVGERKVLGNTPGCLSPWKTDETCLNGREKLSPQNRRLRTSDFTFLTSVLLFKTTGCKRMAAQ